MTDPIVAFLEARYAEEAEFAREASDRDWFSTDNYVEDQNGGEVARFELKGDARHAASWGPRRVLADVASKRAILDEHRTEITRTSGAGNFSLRYECATCHRPAYTTGLEYCATLRLLAAPYEDHPDFDPSWSS